MTTNKSTHATPTALLKSSYVDRASNGLLITESTFIAAEAGGYDLSPGIYSPAQIDAWKPIVSDIHAKGGVVYCQLTALGRVNPGTDPLAPIVVGPSTKSALKFDQPVQMTVADIQRYIGHHVHAAKCAMEAGFDGCEIQAAHGFLLDQFLQADANCMRNDEYGGSLEVYHFCLYSKNRARFTLEVMEAVANTIGQDRLAIRISPFSPGNDMGLEHDPYETWGYLCKEIHLRFPKLAYISITDPQLGPDSRQGCEKWNAYSSDPFRAIFRGVDPKLVSNLKENETFIFDDPDIEHPTVFFSGGGYTSENAGKAVQRTGDVAGFGRLFISNSDLPILVLESRVILPCTRDEIKKWFST